MSDNPYQRMSLDRVRSDALHGVQLAREAYRRRDAVHADIDLGPVIDPAEHRIMAEICGRGSSNVG